MTDEKIIGLALIKGFMLHSGHGQQEHKLMPVSDSATLIAFARAILEAAKQDTTP